ncbi:magnesium transporter NIPA-domain-containing protein [Bisporella sp. PMI_857]|nr:magnesium transporter NIPA-domain-containing protein [Bisporella sp. PMI_857]
MDQVGHTLATAHLIYARANETESHNPLKQSRPPIFKAVGIALAIASGVFIGISFVLKKVGLLKANVKYDEVAGEGYGYLKNWYWWGGMTLMIIGEVCNFVAYAFVDAILVTPMGALSVVITAILSAIFLKERLSMVGMVGCFLCIIGSVTIVMNAPSESAVANIQEMQHFVIAPGFLSYAGVVIVGSIFTALWAGPRYGKKSMLVYLSICSLIGGLSVVATQGLGSAIIAQIQGTKQYDQWFLYVLFVFVIVTLLTEIVYLNKALNIFNASLVTPTYYVFFTSATIITSAILFRGFKGTVTSIITVVMGFFTICAGVVLLQLSKSAKDVPDTAVFAGNLDQVRTIAEQEQPESEPKADAIRGTAAIVRRLSTVRQKKEIEELKRIHDEKQLDLFPIGENEQFEWDGLRRRRTTIGTNSLRSRGNSTPFPPYQETPHPPLGMSHFPEDTDSDEERERERERRNTSVSLFTRARSIMTPSRHGTVTSTSGQSDMQSPMHPVPLTQISIPSYGRTDGPYYTHDQGSKPYLTPYGKTEYEGAAGERHITILDPERTGSQGSSLHPHAALRDQGPTPPPHSARRQFSFQNVFRKGRDHAHSPVSSEEPIAQSRSPIIRKGMSTRKNSAASKGATEEERLGLVKGDTRTGKESTPDYDDDDYEHDDDDWSVEDKLPRAQSQSPDRGPPRDLTPPKRRDTKELELGGSVDDEENYQRQRRKWDAQGGNAKGRATSSYRRDDQNDDGAFI